MPHEIWFAPSDSAFYYSGKGVVTGLEVLAAVRSFRSLVQNSPITRILVDLSTATALEISNPQVRELAAISLDASRFCSEARFALAAPQPQVFGLARMWDVFMEGSSWEIQLFRSRESAAAWLDLPLLPRNGVALQSAP